MSKKENLFVKVLNFGLIIFDGDKLDIGKDGSFFVLICNLVDVFVNNFILVGNFDLGVNVFDFLGIFTVRRFVKVLVVFLLFFFINFLFGMIIRDDREF